MSNPTGTFICKLDSKGRIDRFMSNPTGTFICKLDSKGRLMLPADFREQLGSEAEEELVLRPGLHGNYLELYTTSNWSRRREILMKVNTFDRRKADIVRKYLDGVKRTKLDATGRLLIPKELLDRSGLDKDIVINSMFTNMEIWDKAEYDKRINEFDAEAFAKDAAELFSELEF